MALIVSVEQMRALEAEADRRGVGFDRMMDLAGEAVFSETVRATGPVAGKRVLALCGGGNNGGDGLVAAAHFSKAGAAVSVVLAAERKPDDPRLREARDAGCAIHYRADSAGRNGLVPALDQADVVIDAVLGTGTRLPLRAPAADVLETVRSRFAATGRRPFVTAVDCPSGVDCNSGAAAAESFAADLTVTFGAAKPGLLAFPAAELTGRLIVAGIGWPPDLSGLPSSGPVLADAGMVRPWLRPRPRDSHKGTYGRVIVIGGSARYPGAPTLAAMGAYRAGAGLVTLAGPQSIYPADVGVLPEATWIVLPEDFGVLAPAAAEVLEPELRQAEAVVLGPGIGREKPTVAFRRELFRPGDSPKRAMGFGPAEKTADAGRGRRPPMVVDADALRILAGFPEGIRGLPANSVLTPHPGEMSALTGLSTADVQADRAGTAVRFAKEWNAVVALKGAFTVVAAPDGRCAIEPFATAALARAGTGDVLSGVIAGLVGQGVESWRAAVLGAFLHGRAGELAAVRNGSTDSILTREIADHLPRAIAELRGR
jgi:hydroxyethylthiazole kinase-like uncharacterized protein yjeF